MSETMKWTVVCQWEDGYWVVEVPAAHNAASQARRLDQVPERAAEVISLMEGAKVTADQIELDIRYSGRAGKLAEKAKRQRQEAEEVEVRAQALTVEAVHALAERGMTLRDIGKLVGISYQRVQQLRAAAQRAAS